MDPADYGVDQAASADENELHGPSSGEGNSYLLNTEMVSDEQCAVPAEVQDAPVASDVLNTNDVSNTEQNSNAVSVSSEGLQSDSELSQKIITQVEYYFSDENLAKDSFLMQRINRDKRGYVDLKLIASFKKMKKLTQDIDVIATALRNSKKLEVNKGGTMVRRTASLPVTKEEAAALKTVVAVNISETSNLAEQFGSCGTVSRVRVISKNDKVPSDARRHLRRSLDDGGRAVTAFALIEYDDDKCAQVACERLTDSSDWRHGLHVSLLVARQPEKKSSSAKLSPMKESNVIDVKRHTERVEDDMKPVQIKKKSNKKNRSRVEAILQDESAGYSSSGSETEGQEEQREHRASGSNSRRRFSSPRGGGSPADRSIAAHHSVIAHHNISLADDLHGEARARSGSTGAIEYSSRRISPWVQRRLEAAHRETKSAGGSVSDLSAGDAVYSKPTDAVSVVRQPRGPDGTKGFNLVR